MTLTRLIYSSRISENFEHHDIKEILAVANKRNHENGISGLLVFDRNFFLQCLEGPRPEVNLLYCKIVTDPRHQEITLLDVSDITHREFGSWGMGYVPDAKLTQKIIYKYSHTPEFDPASMSGCDAIEMLLELREHIPIIDLREQSEEQRRVKAKPAPPVDTASTTSMRSGTAQA